MRQVPCYYNDDYIVYENGDMIRVKGRKTTGNPLSKCNNGTGYYYNGLMIDNKQKTIATHIIVQKSFMGDYDSTIYEVNHKDENKYNNHISNLELITGVENIRYSTPKRDLPYGLYECKKGNYEYYMVRIQNHNTKILKCFNKKYSNALEQALLYLEEAEIRLGIRKPN